MLGRCEKCGKFTWVNKHHIIPKATKKNNEEDISYLCPTCHTEYHHHLGHKNLKNKSVSYYRNNYYQWLIGVVVLIIYLITNNNL